MDAIKISNLGKCYQLYNSASDKALDVFGLSKWIFWKKIRVKEFWALRDLSLTLKTGERVGIIGRNGAGKSTLLKIISGNFLQTEGDIVVNGKVQALLELGTGFHPEFTGRENIRASLAFQQLSTARIMYLEEEIIDFAELEDFIDQPVKTYSAGMYARLAFSTSTAIEPEILIIDEVLGAGDAYFAGKCVERMKRLTLNSGATILFVSHDLSSVQALCDRVIWIERGRVRQSGDPLDVIKNYSSAVRKDEERRLRARDLKISTKQATLLESNEDVYSKLLFRFVCLDEESPVCKHNIYNLKLFIDGALIGEIDVGSAMDNSSSHLNYIMDSPGYMNWGKACIKSGESYRQFGNFGGRYHHAPFEFSVPKTLFSADGNISLSLKIKATIDRSESVFVELFQDDVYTRVGVVSTDLSSSLDVSFIDKEFIDTKERIVDIDSQSCEDDKYSYGSGEVQITGVKIFDKDGKDCRILEVGSPFSVSIGYSASSEVRNPVFVFCVYLPDGQCACQWIASTEEMGSNSIKGEGAVVFSSDELLLGKSAYVASVAIFKYLRHDGLESESYHVIDRNIHFQVLRNISQNHDSGLCVHPISKELLHDFSS